MDGPAILSPPQPSNSASYSCSGYRDGVIGVYDAAVVSKDADEHVRIHATEKPTEYGALLPKAIR